MLENMTAARDAATGNHQEWDSNFETIVRKFVPYLPGDEPLTASTELRELGLDSMGTVELLAALENSYSVRFRDEALDLNNFANPQILWKTLQDMLSR